MLRKARDQLFAEAVACFNLGEKLWLEEGSAREQAAEIQQSRMVHDGLTDELALFLASEAKKDGVASLDSFELVELFKRFSDSSSSLLNGVRFDASGQRRIGSCLNRLGYRMARLRLNNERKRVWSRVPRGPASV